MFLSKSAGTARRYCVYEVGMCTKHAVQYTRMRVGTAKDTVGKCLADLWLNISVCGYFGGERYTASHEEALQYAAVSDSLAVCMVGVPVQAPVLHV